jgi:hypothetical protein
MLEFFHEVAKSRPALSQEIYRIWEAYKYVNPIPKDYAIIESKDLNGNWYLGEPIEESHTIVKVKRLLDGEVFGIGDEVDFLGGIKAFEVRRDTVVVWFYYNLKDITYPLNNLVKKQKQPLFRTHDGVDIYEWGDYWFINADKNWSIMKRLAKPGHGHGANWQYFSTEQAAKEYILMNKPCLSVNDIANCYYSESDRKKQVLAHADHFYLNDLKANNPLIKRVIDEAKQKINQ